MDIGEIRSVLVSQYNDSEEVAKNLRGLGAGKYRRAVKQVRKDIEELDNIMARNFGMAFNPELKIYE